ncbi:hypothetical protein B6N60_04160 [Richelia sinica FACHB-800]|uniref:Uncharacterized protein n=1 Tax=Richelia sinica FACHB-800 TaxID=1357546 RepID=A0A975TBK1_9NOST|nr:hypothetical protein B6N60_04160 [Richelia sinica FACHB-800]
MLLASGIIGVLGCGCKNGETTPLLPGNQKVDVKTNNQSPIPKGMS